MAATLSASGIVLRPLETADAEALFSAHGDAHTHKYWSSPAHANVQETADYIRDTLDLPGAHVWAITESGGEALGRIGLFVEREGVADIGVELGGRARLRRALPASHRRRYRPRQQQLDLTFPPRRFSARRPAARQLENPSRHPRQRHHG
jgi:RimJ/RimL family protein N-acetyltransferase